MSYIAKLTTLGAAKIADAIANDEPLGLAELAVGDGGGSAIVVDEAMTELVNEVHRVNLNDLRVRPGYANQVIAEGIIMPEDGGFTVREAAVFDVDGDMIAIASHPATYKPELAEGAATLLIPRIIFPVASTSAITLAVDPATVVATRDWVEANFSVAALLPGGTTGQILRKLSNADGDVEWADPAEVNITVHAVEEQVTLSGGQTIVNLSTVTTVGMAAYLEGFRLRRGHHWIPNSGTQLTLQNLPGPVTAGMILNCVQNEPNDDLDVYIRGEVDSLLMSAGVPVRQTVLSAQNDTDGLPNYITAGFGLSVNIAATAMPVVLTAANGFNARGQVNRVGVVSADASISGLTNATTNYLYADIAADGSVTFGKTTFAPIYQFGGSYSTTNGQFVFNIQDMVGKVGNGSSAVQTYRVFIGEAVTSGGVVTSVVNYALMGRYQSPDMVITAANAVKYDFSHNIGVRNVSGLPVVGSVFLRNVIPVSGHAVGDVVDACTYAHGGDAHGPGPMLISRTGRNTASFMTPPAGSTGFMYPSLTVPYGQYFDLAATDWNCFVICNRGW